jgi:hypothetical protein
MALIDFADRRRVPGFGSGLPMKMPGSPNRSELQDMLTQRMVSAQSGSTARGDPVGDARREALFQKYLEEARSFTANMPSRSSAQDEFDYMANDRGRFSPQTPYATRGIDTRFGLAEAVNPSGVSEAPYDPAAISRTDRMFRGMAASNDLVLRPPTARPTNRLMEMSIAKQERSSPLGRAMIAEENRRNYEQSLMELERAKSDNEASSRVEAAYYEHVIGNELKGKTAESVARTQMKGAKDVAGVNARSAEKIAELNNASADNRWTKEEAIRREELRETKKQGELNRRQAAELSSLDRRNALAVERQRGKNAKDLLREQNSDQAIETKMREYIMKETEGDRGKFLQEYKMFLNDVPMKDENDRIYTPNERAKMAMDNVESFRMMQESDRSGSPTEASFYGRAKLGLDGSGRAITPEEQYQSARETERLTKDAKRKAEMQKIKADMEKADPKIAEKTKKAMEGTRQSSDAPAAPAPQPAPRAAPAPQAEASFPFRPRTSPATQPKYDFWGNRVY